MKNRVRMIVVLVCVFVVLPVVGGLVYSFSVSADTAARTTRRRSPRGASKMPWRLRAPTPTPVQCRARRRRRPAATPALVEYSSDERGRCVRALRARQGWSAGCQYRVLSERPLHDPRHLHGALGCAQAAHWLVEGRFQCRANGRCVCGRVRLRPVDCWSVARGRRSDERAINGCFLL